MTEYQEADPRDDRGSRTGRELIDSGKEHIEARIEAGRERIGRIEESIEHRLEELKPKLRGWLHAGTFPLSVLLGAILVILAPDERTRVSTAIFAVTASMLFGVSALYHRRNWGPRAGAVLKRLDHANIFLIIAGTYTPFSVLLLPSGPAQTLLWIVWTGALLGVAFRVLWIGAPRWLYVPVYIALGWVALAYVPGLLHGGGLAVFALVVVGGLLYTVGGVVYGLKKPNPSPRWFGFHEVFHAFTVLAFLAHYTGISLAAYS
ncbi:hemolysin III family protein [Kineosporia rhizophila]|uniref:PAQR family membrane homeostasis protein TrhA n=1 Tax=Kineosporia rhizophila TaxID=84633 RepID=UPI001E5049B0|nr:hemolysin III family protein [Kineosporia rhizophila]MCE0535021.1 hemolysin III family protein [Kineosporia rhizophila]